jgi:hypothetical protein
MEELECALNPKRVRRHSFSQQVELAGRCNGQLGNGRANRGRGEKRMGGVSVVGSSRGTHFHVGEL